jgi:hypothetical protein
MKKSLIERAQLDFTPGRIFVRGLDKGIILEIKSIKLAHCYDEIFCLCSVLWLNNRYYNVTNDVDIFTTELVRRF